MKEPTFDADGYPAEETLDAIRSWPPADPEGLWTFVAAAWKYPDYATIGDHYVELVTGGWSGNEDIVAAINSNAVAYLCYWEASARGGLHVFRRRLNPPEEWEVEIVIRQEERGEA